MDDLKIKGHDNLLKRNKSSVINTDDEAYLAAKKRAKNKDILDEKDIKLLSFLADKHHIAPFYHPKLQFRLKIPIYVERQLTKTSVGVNLNNEIDSDINSISGRYVDFSDSYTEIKFGNWRKQSTLSKQGSEGLVENQSYCCELQDQVYNTCKNAYEELIKLGVAKEQARTILPLNLNTEFIWTGSLWAVIRLAQLRLKSDAQKETRQVVQKMVDCIKNIKENPFEYSLKAFDI